MYKNIKWAIRTASGGTFISNYLTEGVISEEDLEEMKDKIKVTLKSDNGYLSIPVSEEVMFFRVELIESITIIKTKVSTEVYDEVS